MQEGNRTLGVQLRAARILNIPKSVVILSISREISVILARGAASLALRRMIPRDHSFIASSLLFATRNVVPVCARLATHFHTATKKIRMNCAARAAL